MTAVNAVIDGMPNTRESAILSGAVEAVEWSHPMEPRTEDGRRIASRVVIYPAEIEPLEEALSDFSQHPSELEDGKHIAFSKILEKTAENVTPPRIIREDSSEFANDPELSETVAFNMNLASEVSTGGRPLVLENGPDTLNSSDEESLVDERGDEEPNMYTHGLKAPVIRSCSEVARQRASAEFFKKAGYGKWIESPAQSNVSSDMPSSSESSQVPTRPCSVLATDSVPYRSTSRNRFLPSSDTDAPTDAVSSDAAPSDAVSAPSSPMNTRSGSRFDTLTVHAFRAHKLQPVRYPQSRRFRRMLQCHLPRKR
jgi:hypothetical protein